MKCKSCKFKFSTRVDLNAQIENKYTGENQSIQKLETRNSFCKYEFG